MRNIQSLNAVSIADDVYNSLKHDILNLEIKPGEIISENQISKKYNISRTPSRSALQRLKDEGLITSIPYKANFVALLDMEYIKQMIYMRIVLEIDIINNLIKNANDDVIQELEKNIEKQEELQKTGLKAEAFYKLDAEFHKTLFKGTDKLIVWDIIQKSQVHYTRFRMLDIVAVSNFKEICKEHRELLEIIKSKQYDKIEEAVNKHLHGGIVRLGNRIHTDFEEYFIEI